MLNVSYQKVEDACWSPQRTKRTPGSKLNVYLFRYSLRLKLLSSLSYRLRFQGLSLFSAAVKERPWERGFTIVCCCGNADASESGNKQEKEKTGLLLIVPCHAL